MNIQTILKSTIFVIFFISTLWLVAGVPFVFNSPDENANYIFAKTFSESGTFKLHDSANLELGGIIHSRSTLAVGEYIVPKSFFGLSLISGAIGWLFGQVAILLVVPVLAILCVLAWRSIIYKIFKNAQLADLTALMLMIHPAFWYYTGRTMMHNVAFVAFLIFSAWFLISTPWHRWLKDRLWLAEYLNTIFASLMLGLALVIRTAEGIWVLPLAAFLLWYGRKKISWRQLILFILTLALPLTIILTVNNSLYGSPFSTGYTVGEGYIPVQTELEIQPEQVDAVNNPQASSGIAGIFLPFGFHEYNIVHNVWNYGFLLFPWMSILAAIGLLTVFIQRHNLWMMLASITVVLSIWLGIVYGSWWFADNPDPRVISLANSHVRYWLPLFVFASLFSAKAILWLSNMIKHKGARAFTVVIFSIALVILSGWSIFSGQDGFIKVRKNLLTSAEKRQIVLENTESEAIVIVDRADKFLFPDRRVVTPLRSQSTYTAIPALHEVAPLYYFGITLPEEDIDFFNKATLSKVNLKISVVIHAFDETLYQITTIEK
ncbi:MAG: hypothetical protein ABH846_03060 [Patescibacteria group bacterium]